MSEEWLTDGDCDKCRRKKYCKTPCKAHKERFVRRVNNIMYWERMILAKGNVYGEHEERSDH